MSIHHAGAYRIAAQTISSSAPTAIAVKNMATMRGVVLKFSGGNNGNAAATITVANSWDGVTACPASQAFTLAPVATSVVFNGAAGGEGFVQITPSATQLVCATPFIIVSIQAATGDVTGVITDVYPIYEGGEVGAAVNRNMPIPP